MLPFLCVTHTDTKGETMKKETKRKRAALYSTELQRKVRDNERAWREKNAGIQREFGLQRDAAHNDPAEAMQRPAELTSMAAQQYVRADTTLTLDEWQELKSRERRERAENTVKQTELRSVRTAIGAALDIQAVDIATTLDHMSPAERGTFYANLNGKIQAEKLAAQVARRSALALVLENRRRENALRVRAYDEYERDHKA